MRAMKRIRPLRPITVRLPDDLWRILARRADSEGRSIGNLIRLLLELIVKGREPKP